MNYRTILVDFTADASLEARLDVARFLALRFDAAAFICLHVTPPPLELTVWQGGMSAYLPPEFVEAQRRAAQEAKKRARAAFDRAAGADPAMAWREAEGDPARLLADAARSADLVVVGGLEADIAAGPGPAEGLVAATGVPVLILPPRPPRDFGHVALVGWDSSREASRAARDALSFLRAAKRVVLCAVGDGAAAGLDDAAVMLGRHDVSVHPERVGGSDANAGEVLLAQAAAHGADLLVMGAYGHSRLREFVFGGATRHVLDHAALPVLFGG
jgi:nucleotide-binding universal stress UspA family protein